ncbi:MAG TPA: hypothetical protein VKZ63_06065, partial [Kofleriaceae bacterium]|nr:hypothetical protein [Kofleriaceae bacterium]
MRLGWTTSIAISLALGAGCGGGGDPGGDGAGGGPDAGPGEPDGGGDTGGASFIVVSNPVEPCQWENGVEICPPDHNQDLFRIDFDPEVGATGTIRLTDNSDGIPPGDEVRSPDDDTFFALDPARAWIYFGNSLAGAPDIYRIRADGSSPEPELLTKAGSAEYFLALSRDGQTIWFMSDMDGTFDLYRMDADGAGVANLSQSEQDIDEVLALLPDESGFLLRMGSGHDPEGTGEDAEIVHLRLSDGAMLPVTDDRVNSRMVALSRDGQLVFYTRYDDENQDGVVDGGNNLWVARVDGAEPPRRLTSYDAPSLELMAVTPDGARVIYEFRSDKKEIYSLATAGGEPVQLSDSPGGESSYFRLLSADGQVVIYTSNDRPGGFGDIEMYRVPVTGGPSQLLTDFENESYFLPFAHLADAGALLYESPIDGDNDFYVVPMAGGEHVNVT